jgi:DNA-binding PadR family transcriptional regulator
MHRHFFAMDTCWDRRFAGRGRHRDEGEPTGHGGREQRGFGDQEAGGPGMGWGGRGRGGFGARFGRGFGEGRARLFDAGDVKLVILKLLAEQPSYGYQLIKTMEQRLAGGYTPSAGVIYPTLTLLEEEGLAASTTENNKQVYSLTEEGNAHLEASKARVAELFERLEETGRGYERGRSPELMKAFMNLRGAVFARVSRESIKPEQIEKITEAINAAARAIDEL